MANNFILDANCVALWRFESGALTADSKSTMTLTQTGTPTTDTADQKEGGGCVALSSTVSDHFYRTDANLSSDFPMKSGTTNKTISLAFWFKPTVTPTVVQAIIQKHLATGTSRSFKVALDTTRVINLGIGYNGGASTEDVWSANALTVGQWYHIGITFDDATHAYRIRIWDDTAQSLLEDTTGSFTNSIYLNTEALYIGSQSNSSNDLDGKLDEIAVFKDILTADEIDRIRAGTYWTNDFSGDANCVALYRFEDGALTADSKGTNTLTSNGTPVADTSNFVEGAGSVDMGNSDYYSITDANLDAGFPLKSGDTNKKISVVWYMYITYLNATATYLFSKYAAATNGRSLGVTIGTSNQLCANLGYNSGNSYESLGAASPVLAINKWYHCAFTFDDATKAWRIKVYNVTDDTSVTNQTGTSTNNIYINTQPFHIGYRSDLAGVYFNGYIDEYVVFNDIVSDSEIDDIRNGVYGAVAVDFTHQGAIAGAQTYQSQRTIEILRVTEQVVQQYMASGRTIDIVRTANLVEQAYLNSVVMSEHLKVGTLYSSQAWNSYVSFLAGLVLQQEGFRFRNDDGTEATATWKYAQDANMMGAANTPFRVRFVINATGDPGARNWQLEYRRSATNNWRKVN